MTERQGMFTIPTRLFLTPEQRAKLEHMVRAEKSDLASAVSQIVAEFLDTLPEPTPEPVAATPDARGAIRQRRAELARLRARRDAAGGGAPAWLHAYIADLEAEISRIG